MDELTAKSIQEGLTTETFGKHCEFYQEIGSTNTRAVELAKAGAPEGTLVIANAQTAGRGRLGRSWQAPPGRSLLFSLVLRPKIKLMRAQWTTMICSMAAVEAIRCVSGVNTGIKWPNDLTVSGKKLGGVLTELYGTGPALDYAVVGMGINVNILPEEIGPVMTPATSLLAESGCNVSRLEILLALLQNVENYSNKLANGWMPHHKWQTYLATLNQQVSVGSRNDVLDGVAVGVDEFGALLVRDAKGKVHTFLAGDVTLRGHRLGGETDVDASDPAVL